MAFSPFSAGVYTRETFDNPTAQPVIGFVGGAVITSPKGDTEVQKITSQREFLRKYGTPNEADPSMWAAYRYLQYASELNVVRVVPDDAEVAFIDPVVTGGSDTVLEIEAANPGSWGRDIEVVIEQTEDGEDSDIDVAVYYKGERVEFFPGLSYLSVVDGFGNSRDVMEVVNSRSDYIRFTFFDGSHEEYPVGSFEMNQGGVDGNDPITSGDLIQAVDKFANMEEVELDYFINGGWTDPAVQLAMDDVVQSRGDGVAVLDTPNITDVGDLVDFRKNTLNINSSFSALYVGWLKITDPFTGKKIEIPPSGDAAGIYAVTQNESPWAAPGGLRRAVLRRVEGVSKIWSETDRDILYRNGLNPVQSFPGEGVVLWGQKTAASIATPVQRLSGRFLFNYIRNTARVSLRPFVFQANTEFTRNSIFSLLDNFMSNIEANDGVYGYRIVVDRSNNTAFVKEQNQLIVEIYIQPVRDAEFILADVIDVPLNEDL